MRLIWLAILALVCVGCPRQRRAKTETYHLNEPIALGSLNVRVLSHGPRFVLVSGRQGARYSTEPVYAISLRLTNTTGKPWTYQPGHGQRRVRDSHYPTLRDGRGHLLKHVYYRDDLRVEGQLSGRRIIAASGSIDELFLFQQPSADAKMLWFSIPSEWSVSERRILVRFPVERRRAELPPGVPMNTIRRVGSLRLVVLAAKTGFLKLSREGKSAWTTEPTLIITVGLRNRGRSPIVYSPARPGPFSPRLLTKDLKQVNAITAQNAVIEWPSLIRKPTTVGPGVELRDNLLFLVPNDTRRRWLYLHYPLRALGAKGLARFRIPNPVWKRH